MFVCCVSAQYLSIAMLSNLVAVLWSVYVVRAWTRPGRVSARLARAALALAPALGLTPHTMLCSCQPPPPPEQHPKHGGGVGASDKNGAATRTVFPADHDEDVVVNEETHRLRGGASGGDEFRGACRWHLVLDMVDRVFLIGFCVVMVAAILILFIILPYRHGKIFT